MRSRMDKYYNTGDLTDTTKRSKLNEELYRSIYDTAEYSNIEGVARLESDSTIDLEHIKKLLAKREETVKENRLEKLKKIELKEEKLKDENQKDMLRNYDIRDVLIKAKEEKDHTEIDNYRKLDVTTFDDVPKIDTSNFSKEESELKDLIHTITNTSVLKDLEDNDLSLDILGDLKEDDTFIKETAEMQKILLEHEKTKELNLGKDSNTFFTSGVNFNLSDFDEIDDMNKKIKNNGVLIKVLLVFLGIVVLALVLFVIFVLFR